MFKLESSDRAPKIHEGNTESPLLRESNQSLTNFKEPSELSKLKHHTAADATHLPNLDLTDAKSRDGKPVTASKHHDGVPKTETQTNESSPSDASNAQKEGVHNKLAPTTARHNEGDKPNGKILREQPPIQTPASPDLFGNLSFKIPQPEDTGKLR